MTTTLAPPSAIDRRADEIAEGLVTATLPRREWTHTAHVLAAISLVRRGGAAEALAVLRQAIPRYNEVTGTPNTDDGGYHDTLTVFYVWAVDRLLAGGLSPAGVLWHPLVDRRSPLCWWSPDVLWSPAARRRFQPSNLSGPGDPAPTEPSLL